MGHFLEKAACGKPWVRPLGGGDKSSGAFLGWFAFHPKEGAGADGMVTGSLGRLVVALPAGARRPAEHVLSRGDVNFGAHAGSFHCGVPC